MASADFLLGERVICRIMWTIKWHGLFRFFFPIDGFIIPHDKLLTKATTRESRRLVLFCNALFGFFTFFSVFFYSVL